MMTFLCVWTILSLTGYIIYLRWHCACLSYAHQMMARVRHVEGVLNGILTLEERVAAATSLHLWLDTHIPLPAAPPPFYEFWSDHQRG